MPEPKIEEFQGGMMVKTTQKVSEKTTGKTTGKVKKSSEKTTQKTTQKILDILKKSPSIGRIEISEKLGNISEDGVKYQLNKLKKLGVIKRIGPDKGGYWQILD